MRSLLFHCKDYGIKITKMANRPKNIINETVCEKEQKCNNCVVALITVEKNDNIKDSIPKLANEIIKMSEEINHKKDVLLPFAHLSNNLADARTSIQALSELEKTLKQKLSIIRAHFGSHKELLLNIYGHPGNARYREFYSLKGD